MWGQRTIEMAQDTQPMSRTAVTIELDDSEHGILTKIYHKRSVPEFIKQRIRAVLAAASGWQNKEIATKHGLEVHFIGMWRNRFAKHHRCWKQTDAPLRPAMNETLILGWFADQKGRGRKETITPEQRTKIAAMSLESPEQSGLPVTQWTLALLADEAIRRGIVDTISVSSVRTILKKRFVAPPQSILAQCQNRRS